MSKPTLDEDAEIEHLVSQYSKDPRRFMGTIEGKTVARTISEAIALKVMRGEAKQTTEDGKAVLTIRVDDLLKLVNDYEAQLIADIIGGDMPHDTEGEYGLKCDGENDCGCSATYANHWVLPKQRQRAKDRGIDLEATQEKAE